MHAFSRFRRHVVWFVAAVALPLGLLLSLFALSDGPEQIVRGKSAALPLEDDLTPEQERAQALALSDARVQELTVGRGAEVFGVRRLLADQHTAQTAACTEDTCRQVEIYLFDENAAIVAIVHLQANEVLDVLYQPGVHPGISKRQADRALEIALSAPEVIEALGFRPLQADTAPVPGDMPQTTCDGDHYCVAPNFEVDGRRLWAVIDLTTGRLAGTRWGEAEPDQPGRSIPSLPSGCPQPGTASRDGWALSYATTGTDGLHVYDVTYEGVEVLTSVKHLEWHVDYEHYGYRDETGCSGGGGGFPIYPFGETQVLTMTDESGAAIGFEVVQDFRMNNWGDTCNYRYEPHMQFYHDGRFRIASAVYGKGCQVSSIYRPVVRIDIAVNGDGSDSFSYFDQNAWQQVISETYRTPYEEAGHGPHVYGDETRAWAVVDASGRGYFIVGDRGQYAQSRGDDPFLYVTRYRDAEGAVDMGLIGACCFDDHEQGPDAYVDGESVASTNLVLWYVPQMAPIVDVTANDYYCWTVHGEPDPETYPCVTGPQFVPFTANLHTYFPLMRSD